MTKRGATRKLQKKIRTLDNPILFLDNIDSIEWIDEPCNESSRYTKTIECCRKFKGAQGELLRVSNSGEPYKIWMFHRSIFIEGVKKAQRISVGYYVNEVDSRDVIDTNDNPKVFCYFPTSENFNQKRILHAPFLLTASRSELREDKFNDFLIQELAKLSADSLVYLRDIGLRQRNILIDNNLFELITLPKYYRDGSSVLDVWACEYQRIVKENDLLLTSTGKYTSILNAFIARPTKLREVINDKQLTTLMGSSKPLYFVCSQIKAGSNEWEYMTRSLDISIFDYDNFSKTVSADFMSRQSEAWLHRFYKHLNDSNNWSLFKESPIIRTNKGEFVAPYQGGMLNVFRVSANVASDKRIVDPLLIKKRTTKELFEKLGIRELKPIDQIEAIRIKYQKNIDISKEELFEDTYYICNQYLHAKKTAQDSIVDKLTNVLIVSSLIEGNETLVRIGKTYDKNDSLDNYFRGNIESYITLNYEFYESFFKEFDKERVLELFFRLGLKRTPIINPRQKLISELPEHIRHEIQRNPASYGYEIEEFEMHGLEYALSHNLNKDLSLKIWEWLGDTLKNENRWDVLEFRYFYYTNKRSKTQSSMLHLLSNTRWIYTESKPKNTPNKFTRQQMRDAGYCNNETLFDIFEVKRTYEDSISIPDEVKQLARMGEQFAGCTEEERIKARHYIEKLRQHKLKIQPIDDDDWWLYMNSDEQDNSNTTVDISSTGIVSSDIRAEEGKQTLQIHLKRERAPIVAKKFKQFKANIDGDLKCEVCGFSFRKTYGRLGAGYAEAHHIRPISSRQESEETTFDDLCIVCANCHRMLHKTILGKHLSVEELKKIIKR